MDTQTQIDRLIELAIIQRSELKQLVEQLPQLREHLNAEVEKVFDETEPQLRAELEEWTTKQTADKTAALGVALEAKIADLAKSLEVSTQARYNAIIAEREENARLAVQAEAKIAEHAASLPSAVKDIVTAELARFPRAGEIDQLRKEFAEPRGLNPRGKWQAGEIYNKLDLVTINGDSYTSNTDGNRTRPSRSSADWTLVAARGTGGGGGPTSLSELTTVPSDGDLLIGSGTSWVTSNLTAGAGISITVGPGAITISATDGDITLDDGTAASPSLHFTNDPDTGIYRPAANTLGISVSGTQVAYFDENGLTVPSAGVVAGGSIHAGNGNANNPSLSFDGDQDTGFFRHQPNEIGIALGGTQYATLTSTTFSITPVVAMASSLRVNGTTDSSNKDTGAIVTEGGLGVEKSATIGGNLTVTGTSALGDATGGVFYQASLNSNNQGTGVRLLNNNASSRNWYIGSQNNVGNAVEITPSTANNGTTFSTPVWQISSAGNVTQTGNLTVSGTGNSSVAGTLLVATTTNSSNGKLQLADHTTSAGGIGFGTDSYLYRRGTGEFVLGSAINSVLDLDGSSGNTQGVIFKKAGVETARIATPGSSSSLIFYTGSAVTALTLDSSQNATFAGKVTLNGAYTSTTSAALNISGVSIPAITFQTSSGSGRNFFIGSNYSSAGLLTFSGSSSVGGAATTQLLNLDAINEAVKIPVSTASTSTSTGALVVSGGVGVAGAVNVGGAIAIGNTVQTAASVASTHKVTISIGGTTYYLLATNV